MARTSITVVDTGEQTVQNPVSYDTGDSANDMEFINDGKTRLIVSNGTGAACSMTIHSVSDRAGRLGDLTPSVANGDTAIFGPFSPAWWNQPGTGVVHVDMDQNVDIIAVSEA